VVSTCMQLFRTQKQGELWRRVSIHTTFDTTLVELQTGQQGRRFGAS